jgi:alanine racemase
LKSWVEISKSRLKENFRAIQSAAGTGVEVLAVVKANGYGHDAAICGLALVGAKARWLGVSDVEEGARVREQLGESSTRILVMCGMELSDAAAMAQHGLTPVVWTVEHVAAMERAARAAGQRLDVHLEIDTGMGRQGSQPGTNLAAVAERLAGSRWVHCEGVMSHLSCAEIAASKVTQSQCERFANAIAQVTAAGIQPELLHLGNSSAVDEGSTMAWVRETAKKMGARAMVRTGLAVYGMCLPITSKDGKSIENKAEKMGEGRKGQLAAKLKPTLTWKTHVTGLREIQKGATVGYGATFTAKRAMRIALIPVGYADGFRRAASSGLSLGDPAGWVMIAGKKAKVVGRVSMNLTTVDVTGIDAVSVGSEVVLLGEGVSAEDHARWAGTIAYDILCGVKAKFVAR